MAGTRIANDFRNKKKLFESVIAKYGGNKRTNFGIQNLESEYLMQETLLQREAKNIEQYFWKQMVNYTKDLATKASKIEQRVRDSFAGKEWSYNALTREWENTSKTIKI